jgi:hypothetical protein
MSSGYMLKEGGWVKVILHEMYDQSSHKLVSKRRWVTDMLHARGLTESQWKNAMLKSIGLTEQKLILACWDRVSRIMSGLGKASFGYLFFGP